MYQLAKAANLFFILKLFIDLFGSEGEKIIKMFLLCVLSKKMNLRITLGFARD